VDDAEARVSATEHLTLLMSLDLKSTIESHLGLYRAASYLRYHLTQHRLPPYAHKAYESLAVALDGLFSRGHAPAYPDWLSTLNNRQLLQNLRASLFTIIESIRLWGKAQFSAAFAMTGDAFLSELNTLADHLQQSTPQDDFSAFLSGRFIIRLAPDVVYWDQTVWTHPFHAIPPLVNPTPFDYSEEEDDE
jgi:hypothetical protein